VDCQQAKLGRLAGGRCHLGLLLFLRGLTAMLTPDFSPGDRH
jgi:hypothetical protein